MKPSTRSSKRGAGVRRGRQKIPNEDEVTVTEILLTMKKQIAKKKVVSENSFTWGRKKKRSVIVSKPESSPSTHRQIDESRPEKSTAAEAEKSPSTPLSFLPTGSGSDGAASKPKRPSSSKIRFISSKQGSKRKAVDDLTEKYQKIQQEKEILMKKIKAMETHQEQLKAQNLELQAKKQEKINYICKKEDFHVRKLNPVEEHFFKKITMLAPPPPPPPSPPPTPPTPSPPPSPSSPPQKQPPPPPQQQKQPLPPPQKQPQKQPPQKQPPPPPAAQQKPPPQPPQKQLPPPQKQQPPPPPPQPQFNGNFVTMSCMSLEQSIYLYELRLRTAAAARQNRIMRMKKNKRVEVRTARPASYNNNNNDIKIRTAADARQVRIMKLKENKNASKDSTKS